MLLYLPNVTEQRDDGYNSGHVAYTGKYARRLSMVSSAGSRAHVLQQR